MNLLDIKFTYLKHNKADEDKPKYLQFLQTDIHVPEATTTLCQLLVKYNQQATAAASILLPQPERIRFIPLPARVITEAPSFSQQNLAYDCEAIEKREKNR